MTSPSSERLSARLNPEIRFPAQAGDDAEDAVALVDLQTHLVLVVGRGPLEGHG